MASPRLKLVSPKRDEEQHGDSRKESLWSDSLQEGKGLLHLTIKLIFLLLAAVIFLNAGKIYNWIHHKIGPPDVQEWVVVNEAHIRSKPEISTKTNLGMCEQGILFQVIGSQTIGTRTWLEIKFIGESPKNLKPSSRMWIAAENATLLRQ